MFKITHKKPDCIGCGLCAEVAPNYWEMDDEGLARLLSVDKTYKGIEYGLGFDEDKELIEEAIEGCPVQIIGME